MRYVTVLVSLASVPLMLPGCGVDPSQDPSLGNSDDGLSHDETGIDQAWSPGGETAGTDDDSDSGGGDPARENDTEGLLPPPTCSDPDGRDYSVAAAITWTGDYAGAGEDSCVDFAIPDYGAAVRECRGERCSLYELYCDNGAVAWEYVPCPSGCRDGACLPVSPTCSDPDGRDYSVAAAITWTGDYAGASEDSCVDFAIPDYGAAVRECRGERCSVYELYCDNGAVAWEYVPCPSGCRDGACLPPGGEYE